jgi:hypothetical protein
MKAAHETRLKGWIVDVFGEVDIRPIWQVLVAKILHRFWRGFPSA